MNTIKRYSGMLFLLANLVIFWGTLSIIVFFWTKHFYSLSDADYDFVFPGLSFYFVCLLLFLAMFNIFFREIIEKKWFAIVGEVAYISVGIYFVMRVSHDFILSVDFHTCPLLEGCFHTPMTLLGNTLWFLTAEDLQRYTQDIFSLNLAILPLTIVFVMFVYMIYRYYRFQQKKNPVIKKSIGFRFLDQSVLLMLVSFLLGYLFLFNRDYLIVIVCVVIMLGFSTYHMISIYVPRLPIIIHSQALIRGISLIQTISLVVVSYLALIIPIFETRPQSAKDWISLLLYSNMHIQLIYTLVGITIIAALFSQLLLLKQDKWRVSE